jgi:Ca-activated chloride channel homolog
LHFLFLLENRGLLIADWGSTLIMFIRLSSFITVFAVLTVSVAAQRGGGMPSGGSQTGMDSASLQMSLFDLQASQGRKRADGMESQSDAISKLDLKAPGNAKKAYEKGVGALWKKNFTDAVLYLSSATGAYSSYVAAHDALGIAYMDLGQHEKARDEFQTAASLDDHLPGSFANLCRAELAIGDYSAAQRAMEKASSLAPLNLEFLTTLTFAEYLNRQYQQVISTAHQVHERKHESAAIVHYLAALAWHDQGTTDEARHELETYLAEAPNGPVAPKARQMLAHVEAAPAPSTSSSAAQIRKPNLAELAEKKQVAEAEAMCEACSDSSGHGPSPGVGATGERSVEGSSATRVGRGWILKASVDEVALLFAATDHGKSVTDLTSQDIRITDNAEPPAAILGFRSEAELPLRLGLVIDTSDSISGRFTFEQGAADRFIRNVVTGHADLGFLVGFANSVLLVRDFTSDNTKLGEGIQQLAPSGGTALWDAVDFAARKLGSRDEPEAVARILVVITDGDDNSSTETLKQAIQSAQKGQVAVYTISTYEPLTGDVASVPIGERALKVLAEQTGGAAFVPGSIRSLGRSLDELQEVIRSRYLVSYRPAHLQLNGGFRSIDLKAQKSGHRLRVYSRKGYYAKLDSGAKASF